MNDGVLVVNLQIVQLISVAGNEIESTVAIHVGYDDAVAGVAAGRDAADVPVVAVTRADARAGIVAGVDAVDAQSAEHMAYAETIAKLIAAARAARDRD